MSKSGDPKPETTRKKRLIRVHWIQGSSPKETGDVYGTYVEDFRGAITQ